MPILGVFRNCFPYFLSKYTLCETKVLILFLYQMRSHAIKSINDCFIYLFYFFFFFFFFFFLGGGVCFTSQSTAMVMSGWSVHLTALFSLCEFDFLSSSISIIYHIYQCRPFKLSDISCLSW